MIIYHLARLVADGASTVRVMNTYYRELKRDEEVEKMKKTLEAAENIIDNEITKTKQALPAPPAATSTAKEQFRLNLPALMPRMMEILSELPTTAKCNLAKEEDD